MKHLFRLLAVVLLLAWSSPDALAQSSPPPNPNYTRFNTKADGDIPTPAANSVNLFFNGTGFRFKDEAAAFTNIGGIGVGVGSGTAGRIPQFGAGPTLVDSKMTTSGGSSGTWTLYDTGATGITQLVLKSGAHQEDVATPQLRIVNAAGTTPGNYGLNARADATLYITGSHFVAATSTNPLSGMFAGRFSQYKDGDYVWSNSSANAWPAAAVDTGLARSGPGIVKVTDGSTGSGGIGVSDNVTNAVSDALILRHATSDTAAASFGTGLLFQGEEGAGNMQSMAAIQAVYTDVADGSEDADLTLWGTVAGTLTKGWTVSPSLAGVGPMLQAHGIANLQSAISYMVLSTAADQPIYLGNSSEGFKWMMDGTTDAWRPYTDDAHDIGTSSARVKNTYLSQSIQGATSVTLTAATDDPFVQIDVASGSFVGGYIEYTIHADDATDYQSRSGILPFSIVNKGGTETVTIGTVDAATEVFAESAGASTLSNTFTTDNATGSNNVRIRANAVSSLTETTLAIKCRVVITSGTATITFNP